VLEVRNTKTEDVPKARPSTERMTKITGRETDSKKSKNKGN